MNIQEEHISHPEASLRLLRLELDSFQGGRHRHHHMELTWVEAGEGLRFIGDNVQAFQAGDMALVGGRVPHAWVSAQGHAGKRHLATVLQFSPVLLGQPTIPELAQALPLTQSASRGLLITDPCKSEIIDLLKKMREGDALARLSGLIAIIGRLVAHKDQLAPIASQPLKDSPSADRFVQERRIDRVIRWIHQNFESKLVIEEAAELMSVTPAAFSRLFKREVGKNFIDYVNDIRCGEAQLRLHHTDLPVTLIANACGYQTMSHFNRQFLLRTGTSPLAFRQCGRAKQ